VKVYTGSDSFVIRIECGIGRVSTRNRQVEPMTLWYIIFHWVERACCQ